MKRRQFLKGSFVAASTVAINQYYPVGDRTSRFWEKSTDEKILKETPILVLEGSPGKRGQIHGESLRGEIHSLVGAWKENLRNRLRIKPEDHISDFLASTNFIPAITKWTPELLDELKGISEGANLDFDTLFALQCVDEEWWYVRNKYFGISLSSGEKCTVLGVSGQPGQANLLGQNLDLPSYYQGSEVILHIKDPNSQLQSLVPTCAGVISMNGINSAGVGLCLNAVLPLNPSHDGLPVAFVNRGILATTSLKEAVEFVHRIKHASGQTYNIGSKDGIFSLECSAGKVVRYQPFQGAKRICHTNHPLANDDQSVYEKIVKKYPRARANDNSLIRLKDAEKLLLEVKDVVGIEDFKTILSSRVNPEHPVCVDLREDRRGGFTAASMIMKLDEKPELLISNGPPHKNQYQKFTF